MPEALRRWALTDEERNIRINYIKPFMIPQEGRDILELNLDYVSKIADDVQARGYKLGPEFFLKILLTVSLFHISQNGPG